MSRAPRLVARATRRQASELVSGAAKLVADHFHFGFTEIIVEGQCDGSVGDGFGDGEVAGFIAELLDHKRL